jgi:hypothetical protein
VQPLRNLLIGLVHFLSSCGGNRSPPARNGALVFRVELSGVVRARPDHSVVSFAPEGQAILLAVVRTGVAPGRGQQMRGCILCRYFGCRHQSLGSRLEASPLPQREHAPAFRLSPAASADLRPVAATADAPRPNLPCQPSGLVRSGRSARETDLLRQCLLIFLPQGVGLWRPCHVLALRSWGAYFVVGRRTQIRAGGLLASTPATVPLMAGRGQPACFMVIGVDA